MPDEILLIRGARDPIIFYLPGSSGKLIPATRLARRRISLPDIVDSRPLGMRASRFFSQGDGVIPINLQLHAL